MEIWQDNRHGWSLWTPHEDASSFKWRLKRKLIRLRGRIPSKRRLMLVAVFAVLAGVALETWYGHKADDAADNIRARLELDALNMSSRDVRDFATFLKDKPKGEVRVLYKHEDFEAYWFALEICIGLRELGWKVDGEPQSIPSTGGDPAFANKDVPSEVKYDAQTGLAIWGKNTNAWNEGTARSALKNALSSE